MTKTYEKRHLNGVLLLDKPAGITSNAALQITKRLYRAAKAGHTGTLDPIATGLLPICFGEATKFSQYLLNASKQYDAVFKLGVTTTTGDIDGALLAEKPVSITLEHVTQVLKNFVGEISQTPPMYSALKHQGKPLYEYARKGIEIEREARQISIDSLSEVVLRGAVLSMRIACSKGTYVRQLGVDIGEVLGCGAMMQALRRTAVAGFDIIESHPLSELAQMTEADKEAVLLPVDALVPGWPKIQVTVAQAKYILQGQSVTAHFAPLGLIRIYNEDNTFLGMGEIKDDMLYPKRLVVTSAQNGDALPAF